MTIRLNDYHDLPSYRRYVLSHWQEWAGSRVYRFRNGQAVTTILHTDGRFQTERVDMAPHTEIEPHSHPHVDSLEYCLCGAASIRIRHRQFQLQGASPLCLPILRNTVHSGVVGADGLSFLSIQYWSILPTSATLDWAVEGPCACA